MASKFIFGELKFNHSEFKNKSILIPNEIDKNQTSYQARLIIKKKYDNIIDNLKSNRENEKKNFWKNREYSKEDEEYNEIKMRYRTEIENENKKRDEALNNFPLTNAEEKLVELRTKLSISKIIHGYSGLILDNKILFAMHTSRTNSTIWGINDENIEIEEKENPILYINKTQIIDIELFKKYFTVSKPQDMIVSAKYNGHKDIDLAYCSFRALHKSIQKSADILSIRENAEGFEYIKNNVLTESDGKLLTPAEMIIIEDVLKGSEYNISQIEEQINTEMSEICENEEGKRALIEISNHNFNENFRQ